jgi:hypothetical protein
MPRHCCPPSPCGRLSRPRTTTRTPPRPTPISRHRALPGRHQRPGAHGALPTFTMIRLTGRQLAVPLQRFRRALAVSRRRPRRARSAGRGASRHKSGRRRRCGRPMSARFGVGSAIEGLLTPVRLRSTFRSRLHARGRLAVPPGRYVVGGASSRGARSRARTAPQLHRTAASARGRPSNRHGMRCASSFISFRMAPRGAGSTSRASTAPRSSTRSTPAAPRWCPSTARYASDGRARLIAARPAAGSLAPLPVLVQGSCERPVDGAAGDCWLRRKGQSGLALLHLVRSSSETRPGPGSCSRRANRRGGPVFRARKGRDIRRRETRIAGKARLRVRRRAGSRRCGRR